MKSSLPIVISASRRTDIPAFYMEWFMDRIEKGSFDVINPYNHHISVVPATCENVHSIVFWSKNFRPFIENSYGDKLKKRGYNLFFNFTINSYLPLLEPNLPSLADRLDQLESLCSRFNSNTINWRFDPICFYKTRGNQLMDNLPIFTFFIFLPRICTEISQILKIKIQCLSVKLKIPDFSVSRFPGLQASQLPCLQAFIAGLA